jgi:hypothetical protein
MEPESSKPTEPIHQLGEVEQARAAVNQVEQELSTLSKLLPVLKATDLTPRRKRGLMNIGGEAFKFLFGIATTQKCRNCMTR